MRRTEKEWEVEGGRGERYITTLLSWCRMVRGHVGELSVTVLTWVMCRQSVVTATEKVYPVQC